MKHVHAEQEVMRLGPTVEVRELPNHTGCCAARRIFNRVFICHEEATEMVVVMKSRN